METVDLVGLLVPVTYLLMLAVETRWPARAFPARRGWRWLGVGFLVLIGTAGAVVPMLLPLSWMEAHRWMDGTRLGVVGGTALGWFVLSGLAYVWHRAEHTFSPLWRFGHQVHHGPQRVDISGSTLFHPAEMIVQVLLQLFVTVIVLGLDPLAAALVGYVAAFYGMFQHWNVRTPQWLGYIIQRPEAHCVHHRQGVHAWNYGDLPLWDLLMGTFRNPREFRGECGFETPADRRLGAMLAWRDVNAPVYGAGSRGAAPSAAAHGTVA
ncbi:sterol desaturase family protein [Variovorax sp. J22R133]|uniref:sterol desaturase family protein n=1 Tax=Variovorax brevis TaxID=3053503 RepID=UPI0025788C69|nr:sterol desaturase family protein [Variovorax sp. J22R133]MDM0113377.1 sterol desaturase family protein [Variovorax sp. J22R133]